MEGGEGGGGRAIRMRGGGYIRKKAKSASERHVHKENFIKHKYTALRSHKPCGTRSSKPCGAWRRKPCPTGILLTNMPLDLPSNIYIYLSNTRLYKV